MAIVGRYLKADPQAPLFSPAESVAEHNAQRRAARKTPLYQSHIAHMERKRVAAPKRAPTDRYDPCAYGHAIARACARAGVPKWQPHDLRRAVASRIRARYGLEAARVALAHQSIETTTLYATRDLAAAAGIAKEVG